MLRIELVGSMSEGFRSEMVPNAPGECGLGMALIVDTALSLGLWPDGFTQGDGGRTYHYRTA
ncbi:hypothetical protein [Actinoplanes ianthinogenes]|nr:hypothetical protein [Actinoplanes ianthinogenes]